LRSVDAAQVDVAVVVVPDEAGLGLAVLDRLRRAAAPRG
jgi:Putative GTP-binding controlling metal-binding